MSWLDFYIAYFVLEEKDKEEGNMQMLCFCFSQKKKKKVVLYRDIRSYFYEKYISWRQPYRSQSLVVLFYFFALRYTKKLCCVAFLACPFGCAWPCSIVKAGDLTVQSSCCLSSLAWYFLPQQPGLSLSVLLFLTSLKGDPLCPI